MSNETGQLLLFSTGGILFCLAVWYVFFKAHEAWNKEFERCAQRTGLVFGKPRIDPTTIGYMRYVLEGMLGPVGVTLESFRMANSQRAGIHGYTLLSVRCAAQAPVSLAIDVQPRGQPARLPLYPTGDQRFDYIRQVGATEPGAIQKLLPPHVLAVLFNPSGWETYTITYESGVVRVRWPEYLWERKHFEDAIRIAQTVATIAF